EEPPTTPPEPDPLEITTGMLPTAIAGEQYEATVEASGGTPPYAWSATGLPTGLTMHPDGRISGTVIGIGTATLEITVTDSTSTTDTKSFDLEIDRLLQVDASYQHSCGMDTEGTAWCWGSNSDGQLGIEPPGGNNPTAVEIDAPSSFVSFDVGTWFTCGLDADGAIWCWGDNDYGQHGDGNTGSDNTDPVRV